MDTVPSVNKRSPFSKDTKRGADIHSILPAKKVPSINSLKSFKNRSNLFIDVCQLVVRDKKSPQAIYGDSVILNVSITS
jgi:hypothetical protein